MPELMELKVKRLASQMEPKTAIEELEGLCKLFETQPECIGCAAAKPEPRPWISTRIISWAALLAALFLPPLLPLDEIIGTAAAFRGPAVGIHELTLITPTVRIGQPLIIKTRSEYLKVCSWRWVLEWRRAEDNKPIAMVWHQGSAHVIGTISEHEMAFDLPHGIVPGNYIFHESATGECGGRDVAQIIDKDLAFTVTD